MKLFCITCEQHGSPAPVQLLYAGEARGPLYKCPVCKTEIEAVFENPIVKVTKL